MPKSWPRVRPRSSRQNRLREIRPGWGALDGPTSKAKKVERPVAAAHFTDLKADKRPSRPKLPGTTGSIKIYVNNIAIELFLVTPQSKSAGGVAV